MGSQCTPKQYPLKFPFSSTNISANPKDNEIISFDFLGHTTKVKQFVFKFVIPSEKLYDDRYGK